MAASLDTYSWFKLERIVFHGLLSDPPAVRSNDHVWNLSSLEFSDEQNAARNELDYAFVPALPSPCPKVAFADLLVLYDYPKT